MAENKPKGTGDAAAAAGEQPVDVMELARAYGLPLLLGAALAAAIAVGVGAMRSRTRRATQEASRMLLSGRPEQLEALLKEHAKSPFAPVARLALARIDFLNGDYEAAEKRYAEFAAAHADHPFAVVAEINRFQSVEARGLIAEALAGYDGVIARSGVDTLFADIARIGRARCLEQLGRYDEARQGYEAYLAAQPDGPWSGAAETALRSLARKKRAAQAAVIAPVEPLAAVKPEPAAAPAPAAKP